MADKKASTGQGVSNMASDQNAQNVEMLEKLPKCKALEKMKRGELHLISMENAQELFSILTRGGDSELSTEDLRVLKTIQDLNLSDEDIDKLISDCDKESTGKVKLENLHQALQQGSLVYKAVLDELGQGPKVYKPTECTRWDLLDFLRDENDTMEALCSLPITLIAFILFFVLINGHLEMESAYLMQNAIENEVTGEGKPFLGTYVHDVPSFYHWMSTSFISAQFKSSTEKLRQYPYPGRFAAYNQIIGGTQVVKTQSNEPTACFQGETVSTFYDTLNGGRCHKFGSSNQTSEFFLYHIQSSDLVQHVHYLDQLNWIDHNTRLLDFTNLYYNGHLGLFTDFHMNVHWDPSGSVRVLFSMESFLAEPYQNIWLVAIDAVYMLILFRMTYQELMEMLPRLLNGLDGFIQYWEFWNVVDWLNILFGFIFFALWGLIVAAVTGSLRDAIQKLPTKDLDNWVVTNQTYFDTTQFGDQIKDLEAYKDLVAGVHTVGGEIASLHVNLRLITFFYCFTLMLKFFKAFRANPRLNIVINTIIEAAVDIIHFLLVFLTIMLVFSMMAVCVFGSKIREFHTQERSFFMCWRILLGEWDVEAMEAVNYTYANIWFLGFQIMVNMILLNMLLAIIMDTYGAVVGKDSQRKTIWAQTREAVNTVRETRGHVDMMYMICEMEDEDQKAHPGEKVNNKSLRKAFERDKMTRLNAEYLIRRTAEFKQTRAETSDLKMSDAIRLVGQTKTMVLKISQDTAKTVAMMQAKEREPQDLRHDAIMAGLDPNDPQVIMQMKQQNKSAPMITDGVPMDPMGKPFGAQGSNGHNHMPGQPNGHANAHGLTAIQLNQVNNYGAPGMGMGANGAMGPNGMHMDPMGNMINPQGAHPFGVQHDPFTAGNAQNVLAQNALKDPMQLSIQAASQAGGFGATGNTMGSTGVSNMSLTPGLSHGHAQQPTMQASHGGMPAMAMGGGMGGNPAQMQAMMTMMSTMQIQMAQMHEMVLDQRNYIEQRDSWLETRMSQLDRRCQKVEVLSDRLYTLLRQFDVADLAQVPKEVAKTLNNHLERLENYSDGPSLPTSPGLRALGDASTLDGFEDSPSPPTNAASAALATIDNDQAQHHHHGHHHGNSQQMHEEIKTMARQMEVLVSHAEATPQMTRLLWRMDLNLRQLTGTASNLPANASAAAAADGGRKAANKGRAGTMIGNKAQTNKSSSASASDGPGSRSESYT